MKHTTFSCLLIVLSSFVPGSAAADDPSESKRPNIVFILADDMGYGDLKAHSPQSKIPTPHLDRLADAGLVFTDGHAGGSTCKPSRYALITGRFTARRGKLIDKAGPIIEAGRATLIHCSRGRDRTALVGAYFVACAEDLDADFAIAKIRDVRPDALFAPRWEPMALRLIDELMSRRKRRPGRSR